MESRILKVDYYYSADAKAEFVERFGVHYLPEDNMFQFNFFQIEHPLAYGNKQEVLQYMDSLTEVKAKCTTSIVMSPSRAIELVSHVLKVAKANEEELGELLKQVDFNE